MKKRSIFGAHLYNQIVYPLLAASVIVGIVATIVAVYFLEDLTDRWVSEIARTSTESMVYRYRGYAEQFVRDARMVVSVSDSLAEAEGASTGAFLQSVTMHGDSLDYDAVVVLDEAQCVVAATGNTTAAIGAKLFPDERTEDTARAHACFDTIKQRPVLTALVPMEAPGGGARYTLVLSRFVDDAMLRTFAVSDGTAVCLYASDYKPLGLVVGGGFDKITNASIAAALRRPEGAVSRALHGAGPYESGSATARISGSSYQVWAQRLQLPGSISPDSFGYIVSVVGQGVSEQAGRTTRNLIAMWSLVAVVALVGLGGWIARRVSDPLVQLASGARRLADGDFDTKVEVTGNNEVAELAETFNEMTDSLRERSESLTKKVLELATLYEMSRALGSTLDMNELLGSVLESALRIFDLDLGYVMLRDKDSGAPDLRAIRGTSASPADGAVRSSMSEWVVREGRPLIFNPDSGSGEGQVDTVTGAKAALCVPLISPEGTIGSITIGSSRSDYRFSSDDVRLLSTIANHVTIAVGNIELFTSLQEAYLATVRSLAAAVDAKDSYTRGHSERVAQYATLMATHMGLGHDQRIALEMAAYLHDIGKIGVKENILLKPGRLDDDEMAQMRHHPLIGANILKPVAFPWAITPVVRHHHECYDGSGYPAGLKGEEIPLLARILTVADSYEAMTADRPYRAGRSAQEAVEELKRCCGSQFDPRVVAVFEEVVAGLEEEGGVLPSAVSDEAAPEEARAIFAAIVDGVFHSFRRLGGPRLAANVETEADKYFDAEEMPFRVHRGRLTFTTDSPKTIDEELVLMRTALRRIDAIMGHVSGSTLVEHFYNDALDTMSGRMRQMARTLDFLSVEAQ